MPPIPSQTHPRSRYCQIERPSLSKDLLNCFIRKRWIKGRVGKKGRQTDTGNHSRPKTLLARLVLLVRDGCVVVGRFAKRRGRQNDRVVIRGAYYLVARPYHSQHDDCFVRRILQRRFLHSAVSVKMKALLGFSLVATLSTCTHPSQRVVFEWDLRFLRFKDS